MNKLLRKYGNQPLFYQFLRKMKLTIFILTVSILSSFSAETYSQITKLTISQNNSTLLNVLKAIEVQSEFKFFYNEGVEVNRPVSVEVIQKSVTDILDKVLSSTSVKYKVLGRQIALYDKKEMEPFMSEQQGKKVTGKVTEQAGVPIPGASVVVKGTTTGVTTDNDGNFSLINVPENATLQFSFVGMKMQEIPVSKKTAINVVMEEETIGIEEVVAVGYGTMRKSDVTGSIVRADITKLKESPNISIGQSLQGTVPGLNVGAVNTAGSDPSITIRGRTSISGSQSPLIVLDGIIYRGSLVDISPDDIGTIDVLKDASASAIYGSQASNGVILITSKTVKAMSKPTIEYSGSLALQGSTNNKMLPLDKEGFLQLVADRFFTESRTGADLLQPNPSWDASKHLMDANAVNGYINGVNTDWWSLGTNNHPYIQSHNLSIRGRSELSNYFMSFGLADQKNLVINDTYKRYNIRINLDTKITNHR